MTLFAAARRAAGPWALWIGCVGLAGGGLASGAARAQDGAAPPTARATAERPRAPRPPAAPRFEFDWTAPDELLPFLQRHIELERYRRLRSLDAGELNRLIAQAPANLRELLATQGHFSPQVSVSLRPAATAPSTETADDDTDPADPAGNATALPSLGTVVVAVTPGPAATVRRVTVSWRGPVATDDGAAAQREAIAREAAALEGGRFTQAAWDGTKGAAVRALAAQRFPAARLSNSLADVDATAAAVDLYLELDSGEAARFGPVVVQGAERYDAATVQRLVALAGVTPGADYDLARLQQAQQRISETGQYDSAFVYVDAAGADGQLPVVVQLRESRRQKLVLGIGGSTDNGARLSLEHTHNRLPGIGWRAQSALRLERLDRLARTAWSAPVDDDGWRWITEGQLARQLTDNTTTDSQRLRAGRAQDGEAYDRSVYLQFDRARVTNPVLGRDETEAALTANMAWTRRRFDDPITPRRGHGLSVEAGLGTTLGSERQPFARAQARWLGLWPLDREASARPRWGRLALRLEGGAVAARDGVRLPETQLFLTGGDNTVRGYGLREIGVPQADGSVAAGRTKAVISLEWQRPVGGEGGSGGNSGSGGPGRSATPWEHVVFIDGGAVADRARDLRPRWGVGTGVRYNSPVGPLQADLAYGLETRQWRLHLSVGFVF